MKLSPSASMVLSIAKNMIERGDEVPPNMTAIMVQELLRIRQKEKNYYTLVLTESEIQVLMEVIGWANPRMRSNAKNEANKYNTGNTGKYAKKLESYRTAKRKISRMIADKPFLG